MGGAAVGELAIRGPHHPGMLVLMWRVLAGLRLGVEYQVLHLLVMLRLHVAIHLTCLVTLIGLVIHRRLLDRTPTFTVPFYPRYPLSLDQDMLHHRVEERMAMRPQGRCSSPPRAGVASHRPLRPTTPITILTTTTPTIYRIITCHMDTLLPLLPAVVYLRRVRHSRQCRHLHRRRANGHHHRLAPLLMQRRSSVDHAVLAWTF